jgi:hypothetical protein
MTLPTASVVMANVKNIRQVSQRTSRALSCLVASSFIEPPALKISLVRGDIAVTWPVMAIVCKSRYAG